ncbi:uncharacterized protein LOC130757970 [Actinidia eriantha]|uniref:uncharacterized protein LOC130757970 n=1 Tax=Actinidia eriantha TaxID=165200 RepID=UPI002587F764|nr:uncharacterized protein LOC130757970 [Actinidia eriantha]
MCTRGVGVRTLKKQRMSSKLVSSLMVNKVRARPMISPAYVLYEFEIEYKLIISHHQAWMGVEKAKSEVFGDYASSCDQLRWYVEAAKENNLGSCVDLDIDYESRQFQRFSVSFKACIYGFNYCHPIIFLDGTYLKGRFKGTLWTLLVATAKNGNSVVGAENKENWLCFLKHLASIINPQRVPTFVSDRNVGLMEAMPMVFPSTFHGYCT